VSIREILVFPDPKLMEKASPVQVIDDEIRRLARDMAETMYAAPGVGLAAPQVGESVRLVVIDIHENDKTGNLRVMINPEIIKSDGELVWEEGCLSFPEIYENVQRKASVTVRYTDLEGKERIESGSDLLAVAIQHELDHLDGVLLIDHLGKIKQNLIKKKMKKARESK